MELITRTRVTCPQCGFVAELDIPADQCLYFHVCGGCGIRLRPLSNDCCVFCSYGDVPCIPKQLEGQTAPDAGISARPGLRNEIVELLADDEDILVAEERFLKAQDVPGLMHSLSELRASLEADGLLDE